LCKLGWLTKCDTRKFSDFQLFSQDRRKNSMIRALLLTNWHLFQLIVRMVIHIVLKTSIAFYMPSNTVPINFTVLNGSPSQATETIRSIMNHRFIDKWLSNISFISYYHACSPAACIYEYTDRCSIRSPVTRVISRIRTDQSFWTYFRSIENWLLTLNNEQYLANRLNIFLLVIGLFLASILTKQSIKRLKYPNDPYHYTIIY
jgi:hypothetical protein